MFVMALVLFALPSGMSNVDGRSAASRRVSDPHSTVAILKAAQRADRLSRITTFYIPGEIESVISIGPSALRRMGIRCAYRAPHVSPMVAALLRDLAAGSLAVADVQQIDCRFGVAIQDWLGRDVLTLYFAKAGAYVLVDRVVYRSVGNVRARVLSWSLPPGVKLWKGHAYSLTPEESRIEKELAFRRRKTSEVQSASRSADWPQEAGSPKTKAERSKDLVPPTTTPP